MTVVDADAEVDIKELPVPNDLLLLKFMFLSMGLMTLGVMGCGDPANPNGESQEGAYGNEGEPSFSQFRNNGVPSEVTGSGEESTDELAFPSSGPEAGEEEEEEQEESAFPSPEEEGLPNGSEDSGEEGEPSQWDEDLEIDEGEEALEDPEEEIFDYECTNGQEEECITSCGSVGIRVCSKEWGPCVPPVEVCNGVDDDCDGTADINAQDSELFYPDLDNDGSGNGAQGEYLCDPPSNWVDNGDDCDDDDSSKALDCSDPFDDYGLCGGYDLSTFKSGNASQPELNLLGVYEPISNSVIHVAVNRPTSMVLALSSYEPVEWNLQVSPETTLVQVLVNGYHAQSVVGVPAGVPVEIRSYDQQSGNFGASCGYEYPYTNGGGCNTDALVIGLEQYTGLQLTSFAGCYKKSSFTLE